MAMNISVGQAAAALLGGSAVIGTTYSGYQKYDSLADKEYVIEYVKTATEPLQSDVNQMLSAQIAIQLQELYRARCNGYGNSNVDGMRESLESEYYRRTGRRYQPPSCQYLEATQ